MYKKKNIIIFSIIVILLVIVIGIWLCRKKFSSNTNNNGIKENLYSVRKNEIIQEKNNNIEVTDMQITQRAKQVKVSSTIKNNSKEKIDTFFISIVLYDEGGKAITEIASSPNVVIEPNQLYSLENLYEVNDINNKVKSAKVVSFIANYSRENSKELDVTNLEQ